MSTKTVSDDIRDLKYVGGPLHGKYLGYNPDIKWPPRVKTCISDIKVGEKVGLYYLRGSTLEWRLVQPVRVKLPEDPQ